MIPSVSKPGVLQGEFVEPFITLSDGTKWQLILFHYVDHGDHLFTEQNAGYCNEYGLFSRLQYADAFQYSDEKWHFYVIQDGIEYRWLQPFAPTAGASTVVNGYSGYPEPIYGIATGGNHTESYSSGNVSWGQCGSWTKKTLDGKSGIGGFGGSTSDNICQYYLALYARIDTPIAFFENGVANANSFQEY